MNFAQERVALETTLGRVADAVAKQLLLERFDAFAVEHADAATSAQRKIEIEKAVKALKGEAVALAAHFQPPVDSVLRGWTIGFVVAAILGCFVLVFGFYAPSIGSSAKNAARPEAILVASAIIALVSFGGIFVLRRLLVAPAQAAAQTTDAAGYLPRLAALIAIIFFGGIALYFSALEEPISTVRATRPILVFTLIVAMLGFGGLLMVSSLLPRKAPDGTHEKVDDLETRFRLAREIFLVYAGIFGTIIGFYFGAADEGNIDNPPSVAFTATDGSLTAQVTGGVAPFIGYLSRESPPLDLLMTGKDRLLSLQFDQPSATDKTLIDSLVTGQTEWDDIKLSAEPSAELSAAYSKSLVNCPLGATITVVDGRGRPASVDVKSEALKGFGWPLCGANEADAPAGNSSAAAGGSGEAGANATD